ncbi:hypothetical protein O181_062439 [Austropuccinia psidii MF-1]|uniref:Uncharacterized protein n=1 Tax=Austropuccinia psidii MF-1 TaxID=1389203 RepID=A0A9Q3EKD3_9BASI|nr:hypothetical protein [Austropuccinia psidii MF-1]
MSHHQSFVSPLSRPGFGILNGNEDQHSSSSYVLNRNEDRPSSSSLAPSPHQLIYENERLYHQPNYNYNVDFYRNNSYPDHTHDTESLASSQNNSHTRERHASISGVLFQTPAASQSTQLSTKDLNASPIRQVSLPKTGRSDTKRIRRTNKQIAEDQANRHPKKCLSCTKGMGSTDRNPGFVQSDFENICTYLEDKEHYHGAKKTTWGKKHTRAQAFKRFAQYLNDNHVLGTLNLNGRNLQQRWRTFKCKFVDTTWFLNRTGAGTTDGSNSTIQEEIDERCPCYNRIMGIFGDKQNVVGHNVFDSSSKTKEDKGDSDYSHRDPVGLDTSMESNSNISDSDSLSHRPLVEDLHNKISEQPMKSPSKEIDASVPFPEDDGNREGILDRASTPRFEEIDNQISSGISLSQDGRSQRKIRKRKNAGPQRDLPEKFVSNKPQSLISVLECRLDEQENKWLEHMKSQMLYQHSQDKKTGELKLLEIRENKAIKEMELNYQRDIEMDNNKYRYAQEERAAELHRAQLQFQQEELDIKKAVAKHNDRQMEESGKILAKELDASSVRTQLEYDFKNKELEQTQLRINLELQQSQQRINHEIGAAVRAERLAAITQMRKDGMSQEEIEKNVKIIFDA